MNSDKKDYNEFLMYHLSLVVGSTLLSALSLPCCLVMLTSTLMILSVEGSVWEPLHSV